MSRAKPVRLFPARRDHSPVSPPPDVGGYNPSTFRAACEISGLTAILAVAVLLAGCNKAADTTAKKPQPPVPVLVSPVVEKPMPLQLRAIGNVLAYSTVSVRSLVDGQLTTAHFREGQEVKSGAPLFTIDPRPFQEALKQDEANLARDKAQLENARIEDQRYQALKQNGYASHEDADKYHAAFVALQATVQADESLVSSAKLQLEYTDIRSPIDGCTGSLKKYPGNVIKAKDDELVVINQLHPIYVTFTVPEQYLPEIEKYKRAGTLAVEATVVQHDELRASGELTFINNTVDTATGSIQLKATFRNAENTLWPGQFVNVLLTLTTLPHAIVAPSQAIQTGQNGEFVFVVKADQSVEMRPITLASSRDGLAVIEKGLQAGETVVTDGQLRLMPGSKVEIKSGIGAAAAAPKEATKP